ncbi:MAG TPA: zinc metalloprotease HtpX [Armatimonadota bacterium]|nr:zinc metalloprotease HtpX [Armatimonadota bacterium]
MNTLKTGLLLAGLTIVLVLMGRWLGGTQGMVIAFVMAMVMNVGSYWFSDRIVLSMYHAQPVTPEEVPELYGIISRLTERAGLPMPRLYVVPDPTPNAFATGRDPQHAAVAVNEGLLRVLDRPEVEGVLAHELAHVKNRDTLISTIAATLAGAITMLAHLGQYALLFGGGYGERGRDRDGGAIGGLLMIILGPIAAMLLQLAVSRSREFQADRSGSELTGQPLALASALRKLDAANQVHPMAAEPATAHMFIVNPLRGGFASLFSTHPSTAERVARLEQMAQQPAPGRAAYTWR